MRDMKEREFVKRACENLKEEIMISKIVLLESSKINGEIDYVMYEDRFGRQWQIYLRNGKYMKEEYIPSKI